MLNGTKEIEVARKDYIEAMINRNRVSMWGTIVEKEAGGGIVEITMGEATANGVKGGKFEQKRQLSRKE